MKIAQVAPLYESVPPRLYGGTELVVSALCDALVLLGHEVTLFAAADARTNAYLVPVRERAIRLDPAPLKSDLAAHLHMLDQVRQRANEFHVVHCHTDLLHMPILEAHAHKCVTTLHGRLDMIDLPHVYERWREFALVSISDQQRAPMPRANWVATVPHGLSPRAYEFHERTGGGYLAFLGRIAPEKRPDIAIRVARLAGIPLKIAAKVDSVDRRYFDEVIKPLLDDPSIEYIGEIGSDYKSEFLGNALALLFPVHWPEPFGLAMIESMACGTPVIAWRYGSVPEVVEDGVSGFIVGTEQQALRALERIDSLDRRRVRAAFEHRFADTVMARRYLDVYRELLMPNPLRRAS
jgi:glycosyltransferase involved in cell wall biosynthesis